MTQRNLVRTPRKGRFWTTSPVTEEIFTAGIPGQQATNVATTDFQASTGRNLFGVTLAHTWLKGHWLASAAGDNGIVTVGIGVGVYAEGIDQADFPDLNLHEGDWQLHDVRGLREPITTFTPLVPIQLSSVDINSGGQRKIGSPGMSLWVVFQSDQTPSAGSYNFHGALTCLWLLP